MNALERLEKENAALRACAIQYLSWLEVDAPLAGLEKDLQNPEMVGNNVVLPDIVTRLRAAWLKQESKPPEMDEAADLIESMRYALDDAFTALELARDTFLRYADLHQNKCPPDMEKTFSNLQLASAMQSAVAVIKEAYD